MIFIYASLGVMCVTAGLLVWRELARWCYPAFLYVASLLLLYMTTLWSPYLIGGDLHLEYYLAERTLSSGWDPNMPLNQNAALSITLLVPYLGKALHIGSAWVLKAIIPLFFATVPAILWFIYKKFMERREAFVASLFFVAVPTYFFELSGISRQQVAEVLLCLFVLVLVAFEWRLRWKIPCLVILGLGIIASHYSIGGLFMGYLVLGVALVLILKAVRLESIIPLWALGVVAVVVIVSGGIYYGIVSQGVPLQDLLGGIPFIKGHIGNLSLGLVDAVPPGQGNGISGAGLAISMSGFTHHDQLMKTALGLDFIEVGVTGKVFRLFQFATQFLLIVGTVWFLIHLWREKGWPSEYIAFFIISCGFLLVCVFRPGFSSILNASRFYHLALIFTAPMLVFGGRLLFRSTGLIALCIILPYFLFTSGAVFEATKQPDVSHFEVPYSIALSSHRIDLWGNFTSDDEKVREWIVTNGIEPVYGDLYGSLFLQEKMGYLSPLYPIPYEVEAIPGEANIYLRGYGNARGEVVLWGGPGLRLHKSYGEFGLDSILEGRAVLYQSGGAVLYGVKGD